MDTLESLSSPFEQHRPVAEPTTFLSLPLELREQIYTLYLPTFLNPATYILYRHATSQQWSFRRTDAHPPPALLLVSRQVRHEVSQVLEREFEGPTLALNPNFALGFPSSGELLWDLADERECVFDLEGVLSAARTVKLEVHMSKDENDQKRVFALLEWVVAALNARDLRAAPLRRVEMEVMLGCNGLGSAETEAFWGVLDGLRCERLEVVTSWTRGQKGFLYSRCRLEELCRVTEGRTSEGTGDEGPMEATREALRESCVRERERVWPPIVPRKPIPWADVEGMLKIVKANCSKEDEPS